VSCYVLSIPDGVLYACSDRCATAVFDVLARSATAMISMHWSYEDRDVFCAGCSVPLGWRRASALILYREMTPAVRRLYGEIHERWWRDVAAR
jgi:hypothetical protein